MLSILNTQISEARLIWIPHMKGPSQNTLVKSNNQKVLFIIENVCDIITGLNKVILLD